MHINDLDTPVLLVDEAVMENNLRRAAEYAKAHGIALRPHTKTHKIPAIARRQVALGAAGIAVAKLGEAEVMADAGFDDILIAYPLVGAQKLHRLMALCERARVRISLDSLVVTEGISRAAAAAGHTVGILVEADTGMRRCGLAMGPELVSLCRQVQELPGLQFLGVMVYQGHILGEPEERAAAIAAENERLRRLYDTLAAAGISWQVVSGGSTPNLYQMHLLEGITETRPGTYVFNDRNTLVAGACTLEDVALQVQATVVSTAVSGQVIVDAGSKTLSSDPLLGGDRKGFGLVVEDPTVIVSSCSEEHGKLDISRSTRRWRVGDRVHLIPNHVCPVVNLQDRIVVHRAGEVLGAWSVAGRGRVQ